MDPSAHSDDSLSGKSIVSTIRTMAVLGPLGREVLDAYGITEIDPEGWYPPNLRRDIHRTAHERFGDEALFNFGLNNGDHFTNAKREFAEAEQAYHQTIAQLGEGAHRDALRTQIEKFAATHTQAIRDTFRKAPASFGAWVVDLGSDRYEYHMNSRAELAHEAFNRGIIAWGFTRWIGRYWDCEIETLRQRSEQLEGYNHFVWRVTFTRRSEARNGNELIGELRFAAREALMGKVLADAERQRKLARAAADDLAQAHRLVLDSIRYARLLQEAQLPRAVRTEGRFADIAVHWQPRDTIGGDLWWMTPRSAGSRFTLCVVDCSGHGVPGAMLALLASTSLERIYSTEPSASPARGLQLLGQALRRGLNQDQASDAAEGLQNDGCDAAFVQIDNASGELVFAGANIDMIWMPALGDLTRVQGQSFGLGYRGEEWVTFQETTLQFGSRDRFLITTDGYVDQVGVDGTSGRRRAFGHRRLLSALKSARDWPLSELIEHLKETLKQWQGNESRRDDVTLAAVELKPPATRV